MSTAASLLREAIQFIFNPIISINNLQFNYEETHSLDNSYLVDLLGSFRSARHHLHRHGCRRDGVFKLTVPAGTKTIQITFVGYKPVDLAPAANLGTITMETEALMLNDVVITQSVGKTRETPVALSTINAQELEFKLGNQELLEVLKTTPGVYTRSEQLGRSFRSHFLYPDSARSRRNHAFHAFNRRYNQHNHPHHRR